MNHRTVRRAGLPTFLLAVVLMTVAGCSGDPGRQEPSGRSTATETTAEAADLPDRVLQGRIPQPRLQTKPVVIGGSEGKVRVEAEIADQESERARGLMARRKLGDNRGMLFVFPYEQSPGFYMKNTVIPLSIAYIGSRGRIVDIQDMQPLDETPHPPAKPARYALEVNQGFFTGHGVKTGDEARIPDLPE